MLNTLLISLASVAVLFVVFWIISIFDGIWNTVDIAYGLAYPVVIFSAMLVENISIDFSNRIGLMLLLSLIWGIRLGLYLTFRKYGKDEVTGEDKRFKVFRDRLGDSAWWKGFFILYLPQIVLVMIVGLPLFLVAVYSDPATSLATMDFIALVVWLIGFLLESISDFQLWSFRSKEENKNKMYVSGIRRFIRHPSYLGEILCWLGMALFLLAISPFEIILVLGFLSPLLILGSLVRISGINLLDKIFETKEGYKEYKKKSRSLIPFLF